MSIVFFGEVMTMRNEERNKKCTAKHKRDFGVKNHTEKGKRGETGPLVCSLSSLKKVN